MMGKRAPRTFTAILAIFVAAGLTLGCNRNVDTSARGDLPSGHPAVPTDQSTFPAGHPSITARPLASISGTTLPPGHPALPNTTAPAGAAAVRTTLVWTAPASFVVAPSPSPMRLATYKAGEAELSISQAGGGVAANADRWVKQFDEAGQKTAKVTQKTINGFQVTFVEVKGTFGGMGGSSTPGTMLLGAIVDTPDAPHFFKLTGPEAAVTAARADFEKFIDSVKTKI